MALPKEVQDAVAAADSAMVGCDDTIGVRQWQTIRAHLLSQEAELADYKNASLHAADECAAKDAEIERIRRGNLSYAQDNANLLGREHVALKRASLAESRLAAADALLRECRRLAAHFFKEAKPGDLYERIDAHLSENADVQP